jgi:hypothetical protein
MRGDSPRGAVSLVDLLAFTPRVAVATIVGTSVAMIDRTYGHLARDSEEAIRARLETRSARSGAEMVSSGEE